MSSNQATKPIVILFAMGFFGWLVLQARDPFSVMVTLIVSITAVVAMFGLWMWRWR